MSSRAKNIIYSIVLVAAVFIVYKYRQRNANHPIMLEGATMGTTYHVTYFDQQKRNLKPQIDSLLIVFNQSMSTYISDSEIATFNRGNSFQFKLPYFKRVLDKCAEVVSGSGGAFDPTVMPLVNAWGFGPDKQTLPDSAQVDSIKQFVGFEKVDFNADSIWKKIPHVQLDFSAIAKGYGVDVVARLLREHGIANYFVEIGGEVATGGKNLKSKKAWQVGILDPSSTLENQHYLAFASLENKALATSGNYFNYKEVEGRKYSHTIDPATGFPAQREILSASVFADDCMTADAWATAFMAMGHEKAIAVSRKHPELLVFLVFSKGDGIGTYMSEETKDIVRFKN
ncbi:MAG: FAD:protein FMN transferase [Cyclobacteriaceae bacterium]